MSWAVLGRSLALLIGAGIPLLLLVGLFLMAVVRWRETAHQARCREHLRQLVLMGLWQFGEEQAASMPKIGNPRDAEAAAFRRMSSGQHTFPAATLVDSALKPEARLSWYVALLPYLGHDELYRRFELDAGWEAEANRAGVLGQLKVAACPAHYRRSNESQPQSASFVGCSGIGVDAARLPATDARAGLMRYDDGTPAHQLERGFSYTIALIETHRDPGPWAAGGPPTARGLDTTDLPYFGPGRQFGGHPGGGYAAFADGSVRFQARTDSAQILERLARLADTPPDF